MNLLVDLGNARIKWARAQTGSWQVAAALLQDKPLDELFDNLWADVPVPQKVVVACVANPRILQAMDRWLSRHWSLQAHVVKAQRELLGVKNHYREPATLGADRWVALIAAHRMSKRPLSVVDCGTAVTIDAVSAQGDFLGGVILPGLQLLRSSLVGATQEIRETSGDDTTCLGLSTADAVAGGSAFGLAGAIERIVTEQAKQLGEGARVLLTGGDAARILPGLRVEAPVEHVPDLVLRGLALIAEEVL
jgi:type III pantothenate kinase